jgi:hypothetical protein
MNGFVGTIRGPTEGEEKADGSREQQAERKRRRKG